MTYIKDGESCGYFPIDTGGYLIAIGWLDYGYEYNTGAINKLVYEKIQKICSLGISIDLGLPVERNRCAVAVFSMGPS